MTRYIMIAMLAASLVSCTTGRHRSKSLVLLGDSYVSIVPAQEAFQIFECPMITFPWIPTTEILLATWDKWTPDILAAEGPVTVWLSTGGNDPRGSNKPSPEEIAVLVDEVVRRLLALRPDLTIVHAGYNKVRDDCPFTLVDEFAAFITIDDSRYAWVGLDRLDRKDLFGNPKDACHPDLYGFGERIREARRVEVLAASAACKEPYHYVP